MKIYSVSINSNLTDGYGSNKIVALTPYKQVAMKIDVLFPDVQRYMAGTSYRVQEMNFVEWTPELQRLYNQAFILGFKHASPCDTTTDVKIIDGKEYKYTGPAYTEQELALHNTRFDQLREEIRKEFKKQNIIYP